MKKPKVIAIAAVSGGGKTTVVKELVKKLANSKSISFDDYDFPNSPQDYYRWSIEGADYKLWDLSPMVPDIEKNINDKKLDYIFLDYPFAYKNEQIGKYIDYAIFIDTPLDIAFARRILRDYLRRDPNRSKMQSPKKRLEEELDYYLERSRLPYLIHIETVKPSSDIVIDGTLPLNDIVGQIIKECK